jgi:hypothetical protein
VTKLLNHVKHNAVAYLALFVALGGTSYAAVNLPAGSVATKQLRNGAVTNKKLAKGSVGAADLDHKTIGGYVRAYAQVAENGQVFAASPAATTSVWQNSGDSPWGGTIQWSQKLPTDCFALATTEGPAASSASAVFVSGAKAGAQTSVTISAPGEAVNVAIVCQEP